MKFHKSNLATSINNVPINNLNENLHEGINRGCIYF